MFILPGDDLRGLSAHLSTWESVFDKQGKSNNFITDYDEINKEYKIPKVNFQP